MRTEVSLISVIESNPLSNKRTKARFYSGPHRKKSIEFSWLVRTLKLLALTAMIVVGCGLASSSRADWFPAYVGSSNYGPDFYQAAVDDLFHNYPNAKFDGQIEGFKYDANGVPVLFIVDGTVGITPVTGESSAYCNTGQLVTLLGCSTGVLSNQGEPICRLSVGNPLNVISGNKFETATDFKSAGADTLTFRRYYNSDQGYLRAQPAMKSRLGFGWRSEYDRNIIANGSPSDATAVDAIRADGRPVHFIKSGSSWYVAYWNSSINNWSPPTDPLHDIDIKISTDGTNWFITDDTDAVETYDSTYNSDQHVYFGKLLSITDRSGYQRSLTYDSSQNNTLIADSLGRQLVLGYLANGLLDTMTDQDGNVTHYAYVDRSGFTPPPPPGTVGLWALQRVTFADTTFVTYLYEDTRPINRFALTGITDENSKRFATWSYSDAGRAVSSQHAGGADLTTISYDDTGNTRTVTNPLNKQAIYYLERFQSELRINHVAGQPSAHCPGSTVSYDYDSNGFVQDETSGEGRIVHYTHNTVGQETSRTDGYGTSDARTITTMWNSNFHVPDEIDQPNLKTNFYYTSGLLTTLTETDQTAQSIPYSTNGEQRTWQFGYWPNGLLHTVDGPLSNTGTPDIVTYTYNSSNGFLNTITDELGHLTQITAWNGRGQPLTSIDPNNITTNFTYDLRGRLKTFTVNPGSNQALTSFGYDNAGNVSSIVSPDGSTLNYHYDDAHRLLSISNNANDSITYVLDAMGDTTQTVLRTATGGIVKSQTATFDELGRLLNEIGAANQTTQHAYDKDDNEITTTDPRGKIYGHAFDALNRLYQETDPFNNHTTVVYNGKDEVTSIADARSLTTSYVRDGFGDAIQQVSPDTGTTIFWYDQLGNVTKRTDSRSVETDFTYDAKGRIKTRKIHGTTAENVTFTYDTLSGSTYGVNRLRKIADPTGSTTFSYDPLGHVTKEVRLIQFNISQINTYNVSFTSDPAGHPLTITYPSGRIVTYTRNSLGRISGITTKQNSGASSVTIASNVTYQPFGPTKSLQFGNGISLSQTYDLDYELTGIVATNGTTTVQNLTYGYDPAGNISPITDNLAPGRSQNFVYDDINRVMSASGAYGTQGYGYNATGGRTSRTTGGATETYGISPTSNRINVVTTSTNVRSFSYLPTGQVTNDTRDPMNAYVYGYNNVGRLSSVTLNGSTVGTYLTNGAEQRVAKTTGSITTQFIFDRLGHLLAEADGSSGVTQKEYIWLDDVPVAMVDSTGASPIIYFIHTDHLGTPQKMTDSSLNVVWDGVFDPFGNPSSITASAINNLRFPGQYFDVESGLAQNWNRDYDASLGRYTESDPLGLAGGINTYGYADQNPLSEFDPVGTCPFCLAIPFLCYGGVCEAIIAATLLELGLSTPEGKKEVAAVGRALAKACPDPDEECKRLNDDVQVAKSLTAAVGKCRPGMSRWQLQMRYTAWLKEAVSRARRDQKCWVGGDMGHQTAQAQAWTNVGNCAALMK